MKLARLTTIPRIELNSDPLKALNFLRTIGRQWTVWPLDEKTSKRNKIYHECYLWFIIINLFIAFCTIWKAVLESYDHPVIMAKAMSQLMIATDSLSHLVFYRIHRSKLQVLLREVLDFMQSCQNHTSSILKVYYKRFLPLYMILFILYSIASTFFFCVIFITKKKFPIDATYPFSTESSIVIAIIYTHQTFSIIQNSVIIMVDFLVITLFWYAGARIRILEHRLKVARNDSTFTECIMDHQDIIRFVQTSVNTVRFIMYKTISVVAVILISAGIQLLYFDAAAVLSQFTLIVIVASLRIITFSSTIDEVKQLNNNLRWMIYRSDCFQYCSINKKHVSIFIHRCQTPLVTVNGYILNIMSLTFFAKFMYTTISHLTTLRAIIERTSGSKY